MRKLLSILLIVMILGLSGCRQTNSEYTDSSEVELEENIESQKKNEATTPNESKSPGYATDNAGVKGNNQYSSGITPDGVELAEPYKFKGKVYEVETENNESIANEVDSESPVSNISDLEQELAKYIDNDTGELIINTMENESEEEAKIRIQAEVDRINIALSDKDTSVDKEIKDYIDELRILVIDNLYYNGLVVLKGVVSVDEFNDNHVISMDSVIKTLKRNLENVEYCDTLINENLNSYNSVISSWDKLKNILISCRTELAGIDTGEEWINANISEKLNIDKEVELFGKTLDKVNQT